MKRSASDLTVVLGFFAKAFFKNGLLSDTGVQVLPPIYQKLAHSPLTMDNSLFWVDSASNLCLGGAGSQVLGPIIWGLLLSADTMSDKIPWKARLFKSSNCFCRELPVAYTDMLPPSSTWLDSLSFAMIEVKAGIKTSSVYKRDVLRGNALKLKIY